MALAGYSPSYHLWVRLDSSAAGHEQVIFAELVEPRLLTLFEDTSRTVSHDHRSHAMGRLWHCGYNCMAIASCHLWVRLDNHRSRSLEQVILRNWWSRLLCCV
jgi:hypothetical protein